MKNLLKDSFFDDINSHSLDIYQRKIILDNTQNLLVVAGAGSGKTLTIIGKIKYLIEKLNYNPKEILCISFTNETVSNLKNKVPYNIDIFTFHKLSLELLKDHNYNYNICTENLLEYITNEFYESIIYINNLDKYIQYYTNKSLLDLKSNYPKQYQILLNITISFIKRIKTNNLSIEDIKLLINKSNTKQKSLLIVILNIYSIYQEELNSLNQIDFDDMIIKAIEITKNNDFKRKYKYIIIDEFQDTSPIRYQLINQIINKTNSKLMCVGDDFQSIYKFSGCNLDLFINFKKYFKNSKIKYLKNVYRNSYQVINTSQKFIKKNHYQLKKKLYAHSYLKDSLYIIYYNNQTYKETFFKLLDYLNNNNQNNILILGRYNNDINTLTNNLEYKDLNLNYLTVHKSKGLEEEDIIILNLVDNYKGFPSKIEDDEIFKLMNYDKENYPYAEERRLFYVALTRTKKHVYMLVNKDNPSIFIDEIKSNCRELIL